MTSSRLIVEADSFYTITYHTSSTLQLSLGFYDDDTTVTLKSDAVRDYDWTIQNEFISANESVSEPTNDSSPHGETTDGKCVDATSCYVVDSFNCWTSHKIIGNCIEIQSIFEIDQSECASCDATDLTAGTSHEDGSVSLTSAEIRSVLSFYSGGIYEDCVSYGDREAAGEISHFSSSQPDAQTLNESYEVYVGDTGTINDLCVWYEISSRNSATVHRDLGRLYAFTKKPMKRSELMIDEEEKNLAFRDEERVLGGCTDSHSFFEISENGISDEHDLNESLFEEKEDAVRVVTNEEIFPLIDSSCVSKCRDVLSWYEVAWKECPKHHVISSSSICVKSTRLIEHKIEDQENTDGKEPHTDSLSSFDNGVSSFIEPIVNVKSYSLKMNTDNSQSEFLQSDLSSDKVDSSHRATVVDADSYFEILQDDFSSDQVGQDDVDGSLAVQSDAVHDDEFTRIWATEEQRPLYMTQESIEIRDVQAADDSADGKCLDACSCFQFGSRNCATTQKVLIGEGPRPSHSVETEEYTLSGEVKASLIETEHHGHAHASSSLHCCELPVYFSPPIRSQRLSSVEAPVLDDNEGESTFSSQRSSGPPSRGYYKLVTVEESLSQSRGVEDAIFVDTNGQDVSPISPTSSTPLKSSAGSHEGYSWRGSDPRLSSGDNSRQDFLNSSVKSPARRRKWFSMDGLESDQESLMWDSFMYGSETRLSSRDDSMGMAYRSRRRNLEVGGPGEFSDDELTMDSTWECPTDRVSINLALQHLYEKLVEAKALLARSMLARELAGEVQRMRKLSTCCETCLLRLEEMKKVEDTTSVTTSTEVVAGETTIEITVDSLTSEWMLVKERCDGRLMLARRLEELETLLREVTCKLKSMNARLEEIGEGSDGRGLEKSMGECRYNSGLLEEWSRKVEEHQSAVLGAARGVEERQVENLRWRLDYVQVVRGWMDSTACRNKELLLRLSTMLEDIEKLVRNCELDIVDMKERCYSLDTETLLKRVEACRSDLARARHLLKIAHGQGEEASIRRLHSRIEDCDRELDQFVFNCVDGSDMEIVRRRNVKSLRGGLLETHKESSLTWSRVYARARGCLCCCLPLVLLLLALLFIFLLLLSPRCDGRIVLTLPSFTPVIRYSSGTPI